MVVVVVVVVAATTTGEIGKSQGCLPRSGYVLCYLLPFFCVYSPATSYMFRSPSPSLALPPSLLSP